ncbi:hypothetical protein CYMTET_4620 [Cymbomonas tetramitiformis]|uniref:Uncharacterized protein n=1 Tax=Cymbomonas tetramitiformis TaxID=36881 RepID=A0AAE0H0T6_9CHLO|nr:hypothetical protein CYMTET_4620 [Cymbomonas tetramitiformis]
MWRNSENGDFWKCPEKSIEVFSILDETMDTEIGGTAVLPAGEIGLSTLSLGTTDFDSLVKLPNGWTACKLKKKAKTYLANRN